MGRHVRYQSLRPGCGAEGGWHIPVGEAVDTPPPPDDNGQGDAGGALASSVGAPAGVRRSAVQDQLAVRPTEALARRAIGWISPRGEAVDSSGANALARCQGWTGRQPRGQHREDREVAASVLRASSYNGRQQHDQHDPRIRPGVFLGALLRRRVLPPRYRRNVSAGSLQAAHDRGTVQDVGRNEENIQLVSLLGITLRSSGGIILRTGTSMRSCRVNC